MSEELQTTLNKTKAESPDLSPVQVEICKALRNGNTRQASFGHVGVARDTFYRWLKENRTFSDAVTRAEASAEVCFVTTLAKAAGQDGDWRAAESWLKRRRRNDWGDNITARADQEVESLLASLFGEEAGGSPEAVSSGGTEDFALHFTDADAA